MFCTKCGTKVPDGNLFCQNCGNRIDARVATAPAGGLKMPRNAASFVPAAPAAPAAPEAPVNSAFKPAAAFDAPASFSEPAYQPAEPVFEAIKEPVYQPPEPVYQPPEPAYQPPEPAYQPPEPAYQPAEPVYKQPEPAYQPPEPAYQPAEPVYAQPAYQPAPVAPAAPAAPVYEQPVKAGKARLSGGAKVFAFLAALLMLAAAALTWFVKFQMTFKLSIKDGSYVLDGEASPIVNNLSLSDLGRMPFMIGIMAALGIAGILLLLCSFGVIRSRGVLAFSGLLGLLGLAAFGVVFYLLIKDTGANWQSYLPAEWKDYLQKAFDSGRSVIATDTVPVTTSMSLFDMDWVGFAVPGAAGLGTIFAFLASFFKKKEA